MKKKKSKEKRIGYRQIFLIICAAFWCIFPFISRFIIKKIPEIETKFFSNAAGEIIDLLLFCKEVAIAGFAGAVLLYFIGERIFPDNIEKLDRERFKRIRFPLIFIGVYVLFSILSFIFSDYKETSFWGANSEYEGLLAILSYSVVFVFALYYLKYGKQNSKALSSGKIFTTAITVISIITGILTLIEIFYKPILEIPIIQDLISPSKYRELARSIKNENFIGQICLTFNNPGFLGGFCALLLPVTFAVSQEGKALKRWILTVMGAILILAVKWSDSKVAMIALAICFPLSVLFSFIHMERLNPETSGTIGINKDYVKTKRKNLIISFATMLVLGVGLIVLSGILPNYSSRIRPEGKPESSAVSTGGKYKLSKAEIKDGVLRLESGDKLLEVSVDKEIAKKCFADYFDSDFSECLIFSDGKEIIEGRAPAVLKATNIREEKQGFTFTDERYKDIKVCVERALLIFDFGYSGSVEFYIKEDGIKIFGQGSALLDEIPQPAVTGLEGIYSFATGRGYIWAQSLPIIKDSILVGGGHGTFAFRFRQNEIVGLLNTHGSCKYVVDRPHNWYLQIACSDGVIALLAVLALFIFFIIRSVKSLFAKKTRENNIEILDIGLFAGLIGFMLCGLINDSCITVNPLFWLFLGWALARQCDNPLFFKEKLD